MNTARAARLAMPIAGLMIAHQVAAKAVRDATFLTAWPASALPAIVIATACLVVAVVPIYSRLLERFGPRHVVSIGFVLSALGHGVEWWLSDRGPGIAIAVYLHVAGLSGLLLSGFWSLVSELFDPRSARATFGRIAAVGTAGGLLGGLATAQIGSHMAPSSALLLLAALHLCCAAGVAALGTQSDRPAAVPLKNELPVAAAGGGFLRSSPHVRTLAFIVVLGSASAVMLDYLLKAHAVERVGTGPELLRFFATFYLVVQIATFVVQFGVNAFVQRYGLGATVSVLPAGVAGMSALNVLYPVFPMIIAARGAEYILRGSLFRGAYELVFVPMAPAEKRRAKTFLDVTCDRAGDAIGAGIVQALLLTSAAYVAGELLAAAIVMSAVSMWLGGRLDALYLRMVERRLTAHGDGTPVVVQSETGWTVLELPAVDRARILGDASQTTASPALADPVLARLADLRSGDRPRVERALDAITRPDTVEIAAIIQLLAWNDLVPRARTVLTRSASAHVGTLADALLDPETDFAIRRRIPRVLGTVGTSRALAALSDGLDDARFEVRYQSSAAIRRLLSRHPHLAVDRARMLLAVERELTVPLPVWQGHRLLDTPETDDESGTQLTTEQDQQNIEHVFSLLAAVLPPEPLAVAFQGIRSGDHTLRGVALEYLESTLPRSMGLELTRLLDAAARPSSGDARGQSDPPRPTRPR